MKIRKVIVCMLVIMICSTMTACSDKMEETIETTYEKINQESNIVLTFDTSFDWNKFYHTVEELNTASTTVIRCHLTKSDSYMTEYFNIYTNYTVCVDEVYKGKQIEKNKEIVIKSLGGTIPLSEYLSLNETKSFETPQTYTNEQLENGLVQDLVDGIVPLESGKEYILYLNQNDDGKYSITGTVQGIFELSGDKMERKLSKLIKSDSEFEKNINKKEWDNKYSSKLKNK